VNPSGYLRQQIEEVALQLVVAETGSSAGESFWMPVLERLSEAAQKEHAAALVKLLPELAAHYGIPVEATRRGGNAVSRYIEKVKKIPELRD